MKKIVLLSTAFAFSIALMAQTDTKTTTTKTTPSLTSKTRATTPSKTPVKPTPVKVAEAKPTKDLTQAQVADAKPAVTETQSQLSADNVIKVNTEKYDFGKIKQGVPVVYYFEIKNISKTPVVVSNTSASCGCTTPDKITDPIAPGATAKLKVQYSAAAVGSFTKDVHITLAGIAQPKTVQITGEVLAPEVPKEVKPNN
jgi:Protein of unknown function (DUF1573)